MVITRARIAFSATLAASALAFAAGLPPAQAQPGAAATVVYGFGGRCPALNWSNPQVRPARALFSLACENGVRSIRWQDWRHSSAFGHATVLTFNGFKLVPHRGTIALSDVRSHRGHLYFSHLVMGWTTRRGLHRTEVLNWRRDHQFWLWVPPLP